MNVTDIANDLKSHIEQGQAWFTKVIEEHVPALLAEGERLNKSPIVQALEGILLPPETEQAIAGLISKFAAAYGTQTTAPGAGSAAAAPAVDEPGPPPVPEQAAAPATS